MDMVMVILPVLIGTSTAGVKTRTGNTTEPAPLEPMVNEVNVTIATMAGAAIVALSVSWVVTIEKPPPPPRVGPRVKPDSVMVTAVAPVGWPPIVRMSCEPVETAFVPVIPLTLDAVTPKDGTGVDEPK